MHRIAAALVLAGALAGCQQATVLRPTPTSGPTATPAASGYDHRYGDNPVAAADAFQLQRRLVARGEYWEVAVSTEPAAAGFPTASDPASVAAARAAARQLVLTVATEVTSSIRGLLAGGDAGQQRYCQGLLDQLRTLGYTGLESARVEVYFTERDRHAELRWTPSAPSTFAVFDNDLSGGDLGRLPSGTTPFPAPPTP